MIGQPTDVKRASFGTSLKYLILGMRPKQWVKNVFVFAGIVFAENQLFTEAWAIGRVLTVFVLFCLVSGCVYLMNDLADIEKDRQHPKKRLRPLASGKLSPALATAAAWIVGIVALLIPVIMGLLAPVAAVDSPSLWQRLYQSHAAGWYAFGAVLLAYFLLQVAYTFYLKHIVIVDLFAIAGGFVLRAVGGADVYAAAGALPGIGQAPQRAAGA
jgi:4-hydroxybenzoate polyprenyltransferase